MSNLIDSFNEWRRDEGLPEIGTVWEVCPRCHGEGELGGYPGVYTQADFAEDPDFFDDYRAHRRTCEECNGRTTIRTIDITGSSHEVLDAWYEYANEAAQCYAIEAQERSMGA